MLTVSTKTFSLPSLLPSHPFFRSVEVESEMVQLEEELRAVEFQKQQLLARQKLAAQRAHVEHRRAEAAEEEREHLQVGGGGLAVGMVEAWIKGGLGSMMLRWNKCRAVAGYGLVRCGVSSNQNAKPAMPISIKTQNQLCQKVTQDRCGVWSG